METSQEDALTQELRRALAEEVEEVSGQLADLRTRITSAEEKLPAILQVLRDESVALDVVGLPALLASLLVGRGAFVERTALIERSIEHARTYLRALQFLKATEGAGPKERK
jgi:hypothetical protein